MSFPLTGTIWQKVVGPPELVIRENNWMVTVPEDTRFALKYLPPRQSKSLRAVWWGGTVLLVIHMSSYYDQHQTDICTFKGAKICFHGPILTDTNFTRLLKSFLTSRRTERRQQKAKNINTSLDTPFCVFSFLEIWSEVRFVCSRWTMDNIFHSDEISTFSETNIH